MSTTSPFLMDAAYSRSALKWEGGTDPYALFSVLCRLGPYVSYAFVSEG